MFVFFNSEATWKCGTIKLTQTKRTANVGGQSHRNASAYNVAKYVTFYAYGYVCALMINWWPGSEIIWRVVNQNGLISKLG